MNEDIKKDMIFLVELASNEITNLKDDLYRHKRLSKRVYGDWKGWAEYREKTIEKFKNIKEKYKI